MSEKTAPTVAGDQATALTNFQSVHNGHPLTHVGRVVNSSRPQTALDPRGSIPSTFNVWYCQKDHVVFLDLIS